MPDAAGKASGMTAKIPGLGGLELEVLKAIWENPGCTVQEVAEGFAKQRAYARTTILTVMQRLHAKRYLKRRKVDGVFRYSAVEEREKVLSRLIGQFVNTVLDGAPAPFLAFLADGNDLTPKQVAQLRELAEALARNEEEK